MERSKNIKILCPVNQCRIMEILEFPDLLCFIFNGTDKIF